jgi:hypothetical protein
MAATVSEAFRGETGDKSQRTVEFIVTGATDTADALEATSNYITVNYSSQFYDGFPLSNISSEEISYPGGAFRTVATFSLNGKKDPAETSDIEISFDQNLESKRIYRGFSTVASFADATKRTADKDRHGGQINWTADGAEGADVRVPVGGFQLTFYAPVATVTASYRATVLGIVGKVNDATFYGHSAGEVLLTGISGSLRTDADWQLTFRFEVNPNRTSVAIGDNITVTSIEGWDLLWVEYDKAEPDAAGDGSTVQEPVEAFVERIYERADFSDLGLGTS